MLVAVAIIAMGMLPRLAAYQEAEIREFSADNALGFFGNFGKWNRTVSVVYDPDGAPAIFQDEEEFAGFIETAIGIWERICGINMELVGIDAAIQDDSGFAAAQMDNLVRIYWDDDAVDNILARASPVGIFRTHYGYFDFIDGYIKLNKDGNLWSEEINNVSIVRALTHEIGHLIGLGHSDNPNSMLYFNPHAGFAYPREDDIQIARVLYGDPALPVVEGQPVPEWVFVPPVLASDETREFLFNANGVTSTSLHLSAGNPQLFIPNRTIEFVSDELNGEAFVRFNTGGIGDSGNDTAIDIDATLLLVDPSGYLFEEGGGTLRIRCNPFTSCGNRRYSLGRVDNLRNVPGTWTFYLVDYLSDPQAPVTLAELPFDVQHLKDRNRPPQAGVEIGWIDADSFEVTLNLFDLEGDDMKVAWYVPGSTIDTLADLRSGDSVSRIVNLAPGGESTIYVGIQDDSLRYGDMEADESAGEGYQHMIRISAALPLASANDITVVSSRDVVRNDSITAVVLQAVSGAVPVGEIARSDRKRISGASMYIGASSDFGNTRETTFTAEDKIIIGGSVTPDMADIDAPIAIYTALVTVNRKGVEIIQRNEQGVMEAWNADPLTLKPAYLVDAAHETEVVEIFAGKLLPGTYRVFMAYGLSGAPGPLHYNRKAFRFTVLE